MYTTFRSFKKAGACKDGNLRFLSMIENSSANLPDGLDTKIPVWLPLLMNPGESEDISWMFRPELTYIHEKKDFEILFNATRQIVLRYGALQFVNSVAHPSDVWSDTSVLAANPEFVYATIDLQHEFFRVITSNLSVKTDKRLQDAFLAFERVAARKVTNFNEEDSSAAYVVSSFTNTSNDRLASMRTAKSQLISVWSALRMAVLQPEEGPQTSSIIDEYYYSMFVMTNLFTLAKWTCVGLDVKKPLKKERTTRTSTEKAKRTKKSASDELEANSTVEFYLSKYSSLKDAMDLAQYNSLSSLPCAIPTYYYYFEINEPSEPASAIFDDDDDDEEDDASANKSEPDDPLFEYDRNYLHITESDNRVVQSRNESHRITENKVNLRDRFNKVLLSRCDSTFLESNRERWTVAWVHANFDTAAFFNKLKLKGEKPLPLSMHNAVIEASEGKLVETFVHRNEENEFTSGIITVHSPQLMLRIIKMLSSIDFSSLKVTTPLHMRRAEFSTLDKADFSNENSESTTEQTEFTMEAAK